MELRTDWMSHCIQGTGDIPVPCHLSFHKRLFQELGAAGSQMLHRGYLGGFETLIQLSQAMAFPTSPRRPLNSVPGPDFHNSNCQTAVEGA